MTKIMTAYPQLLVYKASAGSGKTFTLAVQYIRQLIEDPCSYRHILAVTFTNKATTEMKTRILEQLYGLAYKLDSSNRYLDELIRLTSRDEDEIRQKAKEALYHIIHDYSRFHIETIDSFFQSVMRNLSRELELGANLSIELNNADILSDAVDRMFEKLDRRSPVLAWLLEYIDERISDDKRWNVSNEIKSFGRNIFDEIYAEKGGNLRKKLEDPHFIPTYRRQVKAIREEALEEMKGFSDQFFGLLETNGLHPSDLKNGEKGISSYFRKISGGKLGDDIHNTTVDKCLESEDNWVSKTSPYKDIIRSLAASTLIEILQTAEKYRPKNNILVNSCDLSLRYLNNLRLLASIDQEVRLQNQIHNRFLLSDTNALLHGLIREGDASFVYEKIGTTINTVMIDEFQDTSRMQWENFHLLLEESLSQKEGSLIVGDIKQSIYRWRNGDWKILANIKDDPSLRVQERTLGTNWRSETHIIQFNNSIFRAACSILNKRYEEEMNKPCTPLLNAYSDVVQGSSKKDERGFVKLTFLTESKQDDYMNATLSELAKEVTRLIGSGIQTNDIAILVRKNKNIPPIADYFDKNTPYRIVSDEAFRLDASLAVCMMVDALRFLVTPENRIAQAQLAVAFQQQILKKETNLNTILLNDISQYLPAEFILQQKELRLMPLYELLEKLFLLFDLKQINEQDAYICAFYDAVTEYMQDNSSELTAFITYWDEKMHEKTIPSGEIDGIRILSIHKSKGLEYHTVLLPFCDWKLENETNNHLIWCSVAGTGKDTDVAPFNELDLVPVSYSGAMADSIYRDSFLNERLQLWIDNLNLLYVAFTRSCKNLIVWGKTNQKGTVSELLQESLQELEGISMEQAEYIPETTEDDKENGQEYEVYTYGCLCLSENKEKEKTANKLTAVPQRIPIRTESFESNIEFKQSNRSADFIRNDDEDAETGRYIRQGQLLHNVFASIRKESDLNSAIEQLFFEGVIESNGQKEQIRKLAVRALKKPEVHDWYNGSWQLYNECSIIYTDQEGRMQTRRPDRVMIKDGKVVVVDFKFGKKKESYRQQVKEYMDLLNAMGYQHVEGYLWYVFSNELEQVNRL